MILHITDTHFGAERPEVVRGLIELAREQRPSLVVLSGDVTQRARRAQFDVARAFMDELCAACGIDAQRDVLIIPGNHDIPLFNLPLRVLDPYGPYVRAFGKRLEPLIRRPDVWLIGVNTTRPWRHKHGELSSAQIERVAARLRAAPDDALRVVVTHQPLMVIEREDRRDLVRGYKAAVDTWVAAGADIFLSWSHSPVVRGASAGVSTSSLGGPDRNCGIAPDSAQVPNSVHLMDYKRNIDSDGIVVERWDCSAGGFECVAHTPLLRQMV